MILPIGAHCSVALALKNNNNRKWSYPFDWINGNLTSNYKLLMKIFTVENIDDFCNDFFNIEKNKLLYLEYNNSYYFLNTEYDIGFPHDELDTIKEKYSRRFKRTKEHFFRDPNVTLVYASRWSFHDDELIEFLNSLQNMRAVVNMITVNAFKNNPNRDDIKCYYVDFPEEMKQLALEQGIWTYDQTTYRENLRLILDKAFNQDYKELL